MTVDAVSWRLFGRSAFVARGRVTPSSETMTAVKARQDVLQRLREELGRLAEGDREGAIAVAVEGYLEGHRRLGGTVG